MDSASIELCNGMYKEFSSLVEEMTNLCIESEKQLEEYKQNLHEKIIPEKLIEDFIETRKQLMSDLLQKAENASYYFPIIDFVDQALNEVEDSIERLDQQCTTVWQTCEDRRPKKGFSLFNSKKQTGTDVPPPTWTHPDYLYNENQLISKLREVQEVSKAASHVYHVFNKQTL